MPPAKKAKARHDHGLEIYRFRGCTIFSNARSNFSPLSSTPSLCAVSMKRLNCSGSSALRLRGVFGSGGFGALVFIRHYLAQVDDDGKTFEPVFGRQWDQLRPIRQD